MSPAQAVELAYLIQEHDRCMKLEAALATATNLALADDIALTFPISGGGSGTAKLPHMLMRDMFYSGVLRKAIKSYRAQVGEQLGEQFGVIIEDEPATAPQGSEAE